MRIGRQVIGRGRAGIGEIAAPAAGHQDLLADLVGVVDHQHAATALARGNGAHQPGGAGTDDQHVVSSLRHRLHPDLPYRAALSTCRIAYTGPPFLEKCRHALLRRDLRSRQARTDQCGRPGQPRAVHPLRLQGLGRGIRLDEFVITQSAPSEFQLQQMLDILRGRLVARKIDIRALDVGDPEVNLGGARQKITIKQGIEQPIAKKLVASLKEAKLKVEAQINGDKLRVTGKKRDDLQEAMAVCARRMSSCRCSSTISATDPDFLLPACGEGSQAVRLWKAADHPSMTFAATTSATASACVSRSVAAASYAWQISSRLADAAALARPTMTAVSTGRSGKRDAAARSATLTAAPRN
jgi:uncharacterized protein YajQ (UPF0234 family)